MVLSKRDTIFLVCAPLSGSRVRAQCTWECIASVGTAYHVSLCIFQYCGITDVLCQPPASRSLRHPIETVWPQAASHADFLGSQQLRRRHPDLEELSLCFGCHFCRDWDGGSSQNVLAVSLVAEYGLPRNKATPMAVGPKLFCGGDCAICSRRHRQQAAHGEEALGVLANIRSTRLGTTYYVRGSLRSSPQGPILQAGPPTGVRCRELLRCICAGCLCFFSVAGAEGIRSVLCRVM